MTFRIHFDNGGNIEVCIYSDNVNEYGLGKQILSSI